MEEKRWNDNKLLIAQNDSNFFLLSFFLSFIILRKSGKRLRSREKALKSRTSTLRSLSFGDSSTFFTKAIFYVAFFPRFSFSFRVRTEVTPSGEIRKWSYSFCPSVRFWKRADGATEKNARKSQKKFQKSATNLSLLSSSLAYDPRSHCFSCKSQLFFDSATKPRTRVGLSGRNGQLNDFVVGFEREGRKGKNARRVKKVPYRPL